MRLACLLILVPSLAACSVQPVGDAPGPIADAWRGTFSGSRCNAGEIALFLDRDGDGYEGSMYYESAAEHERATYHVDATVENGVLRVVQRGVEQSDEGYSWCMGTYSLSLSSSAEAPALSGTYDAQDCRCGGVASLRPYD